MMNNPADGRTMYRYTVKGFDKCACSGEILVREKLLYEGESSREPRLVAWCARCGLVYRAENIMARRTYQIIEDGEHFVARG